MNKFNPGDTIRIINKEGNKEYFNIGELGIVRFHNDQAEDYLVDFPEQRDYWFVREEDMEFVEDAETEVTTPLNGIGPGTPGGDVRSLLEARYETILDGEEEENTHGR